MPRHRDDDDDSDDYDDSQNQVEKVQIRRPKIQRIDKFKTLKKIVINVSMTQYPVVTEVAEQLNWKIQTSNDAGDWDVYWTDFAIDPDILIKMHLFQKINHYPGIHIIARKNLLGMGLMSMRTKFPDQYNFFPLTWMLPLQYADFRAYYEDKPKGKTRTYIAKPEADCQGRGIFLTRKIQDFENGKHYVIQRYVARPYLIQGLKFDMRIYVLLAGTNPMRLYMYNEGLARLATEQYVQPNSSNLQKQYVHLTNYAINKNNPKFIFNNSSNNMGIGHKRSLTAIFKVLAQRGVNVDELKAKIKDVAIKTLITGYPLMSHQYKCSQPQDYSGNMCFHILGLDVMMNSKGQPLLIEVNHTPSFTTDTPLDYKIKFNLIKDTLTLMNVNSKTKVDLMNKAKEINKERLLTGKRQIFQGKEREDMINNAQKMRDQYEDAHLGGYQKIFPCKDEGRLAVYQELIDAANRAYFEENGSIRMRMEEKEAKRMLKSDIRQMKKSKLDENKTKMAKTIEQSEIILQKVKDLQRSLTAKQNQNTQRTQKQTTLQIDNQSNVESDDEDSQPSPQKNTTKSEIQIPSKIDDQIESPKLIKKQSQKIERTQQNAIQSLQNKLAASLHSSEKGVDKLGKQPKKQNFDIKVELKNSSNLQMKPENMSKISQKKVFIKSDMHNQSIKPIANFERSKSRSRQTHKNRHMKYDISKGNPQVLPNISESINATANPSDRIIKKKEEEREKSSNLHRNQKSEPKNNKIYDSMARDIRDMMDRKGGILSHSAIGSGGSGGYVMPKIFCLNFEAEKLKYHEQNIQYIANNKKLNINNLLHE